MKPKMKVVEEGKTILKYRTIFVRSVEAKILRIKVASSKKNILNF